VCVCVYVCVCMCMYVCECVIITNIKKCREKISNFAYDKNTDKYDENE